jgi:hypothetical protein
VAGDELLSPRAYLVRQLVAERRQRSLFVYMRHDDLELGGAGQLHDLL